MPNWVANNLTIHGVNAKEVLRSVLTENNGAEDGYDFDFNKIKPMPESLNIEAGSLTDRGIELFMTAQNPAVDYYGESKMSADRFAKILETLNLTRSFGKYNACLTNKEIAEHEKTAITYFDADSVSQLIHKGEIAVNNMENYGAKDWYDWTCANWGTKWNACNTQISDPETARVYFDTAWSDVSGLMQELSARHPECSFEYEFAEEQAGYYTGLFNFENGKVLSGSNYPEYSKEAYEMFFNLWGCEDEYEFNEKTGTYGLIEAEEM